MDPTGSAHVYIGTHLDSFGASGQVQAGQTLGTVGTTGNAQGTSPHLHFEIHEDGEQIINPLPQPAHRVQVSTPRTPAKANRIPRPPCPVLCPQAPAR